MSDAEGIVSMLIEETRDQVTLQFFLGETDTIRNTIWRGRCLQKHQMNPRLAKRGVVGTVVALLVLTVLEFPPPIGFETRSQANVSPLWSVPFLAIWITEIAAIPLIFKRPKMGAKFAIVAGALNVILILADQLHLMQPEVAPLGYTLLEYSDGLVSIVLIYFAWKVEQEKEIYIK